MVDEKPFVLIWVSQSGEVTFRCGRYGSIPEASDDAPNAKAWLHRQYPATIDPRYPHDIQAGTWHVVPAVQPDEAVPMLR